MQVVESPTREERNDFWSRPIAGIPQLTGEVLIYVGIALVALILRLTDLGARMLHHDESLHATYSYYYYIGRGYIHDPMMHGPWQFTVMAFSYIVFGASEAAGRLPHALFGTVLTVLPFFVRQHLGRAGAIACAVLLTVSPVFLYFTRFAREDAFAVTWAAVAMVAVLRYVSFRRTSALYLLSAAISLFFCTKENSYIFVGILVSFLLVYSLATDRVDLWRVLTGRGAQLPASDLALVAITLSMPLFAGFMYLPLHVANIPNQTGDPIVIATLVVLVAVSAFVGTTWNRAVWLRAAGIFWGIFVVLHTSFFSNPGGLYSGAIGALRYWVDQQGVARGGQPWFYYLVLLPLYEFVPLIFGLAGAIYYALQRPRRLAPLLFIWWAALGMLVYGYTSEKMPWLAVHLTLPFLLLAGMVIGHVVETTDWRAALRRGAVPFGITFSLALVAFFTVLGRETPFGKPVGTVAFQQAVFPWAGLLAVTLLLVWLASRYAASLGSPADRQIAILTVLAGLMVFSVRTAFEAAYQNGDVPVEMVVYTQTTRDVGKVMRTIEATTFRTGASKETFKIAYDSGVSWPFEWYLRDYKGRNFYGSGVPATDAPIVLVSFENGIDTRVKNALGSKYVGQRYRLRAWFDESDYRTLSADGVRKVLADPAERQRWWRFLMHREPLHPSGSTDFMMYVRRDLAIGTWSATQAPSQTADVDLYNQKTRTIAATQQIGAKGTNPGQLTDPRGLAIGPDGAIYVSEAGTHRISKFDAKGQFVTAWGTKGAGEGQFNEPWGIGVSKDGAVYVADTWNHRVQVFDSDGKFVATWAPPAPDKFYGPRTIGLTPEGNVLVADSGNHRVLVFDKAGALIGKFGERGGADGLFAEPIGITVDRMGTIFVADTWNQRVQRFDSTYRPTGQWPVAGWEGESVVNKPYLARDADGFIYATDPENNRVIKFSPAGAVQVVWGKAGSDPASLQLPLGIAVDDQGAVYVVDAQNGRVQKFAPVK